MSLLTDIVEQAQAWSALELVAVVTAILYLLLAIKENIWCWFFAAVSTSIYIWLFMEARLYMESVLNGFYLAMALFGWHVWRSGKTDTQEMPIVTWPLRTHAIAGTSLCLLAAMNGFVLSTLSDAAFPYIDSLTTWFAIWATFLVARKVLENWWYWLVIDIASIFIYWARDLHLTGLLFVLYVGIIPFGLIRWTHRFRAQV